MRYCYSALWLLMIINKTLFADPLQKTVYTVILAGGNGERLWPLSRTKRPKQLLSLYGNKTLLEQTIDRIQSVASCPESIWVVTSAEHEAGIRSCVGTSVGTIVVEPVARNTAAAIIATCERIYLENPDAHVLFLPADSFIPQSDYAAFIEGIKKAVSYIEREDIIVLFGVKPQYPATGYGYIEYENQAINNSVFKVKTFHEKPIRSTAEIYLQNKQMLWNIGMFCAPVHTFLTEAELHCPAIVSGVRAAHYDQKKYALIPSESIDCAIIEKSDHVCVVPLSLTWYDVGNVGVFLSLKEKENPDNHDVIRINAKNNLVDVPNKLVALIDVDDLCIVETDDALLISKRDKIESVKELVKQLKNEGKSRYL